MTQKIRKGLRPVGLPSSKPIVSIIIPCHNCGRWLGEAIESALQQTYSLIKVIVVDDGSTDDSAKIARNHHVTLISQDNKGTSAALNQGVKRAKGEYVVPLGADDKLHPEYVDGCLRVFAEYPNVAFVYTWAIFFGYRAGIFRSSSFSLRRLKLGNFIPGVAMIRKDAILEVGSFDSSLRTLEDWDLWLSLAERGLIGKLLPEPLFYYRQHKRGSRNMPSRALAYSTELAIMSKHPTLFPKFRIAMYKIEKMAEIALPKFVKRILRKISPRTYVSTG